jgi:hypothetical protein
MRVHTGRFTELILGLRSGRLKLPDYPFSYAIMPAKQTGLLGPLDQSYAKEIKK